ncbi:Zn(2)-C6 fungal-type domain-containing protein [Mycena chlorophos]|uniref:Zn(2)-C6 fungal-type domain-containing protein n=1 Tax=Mycena chlorophos TaxID=658473 RepID=A0A8H6WJ61_MYCCL|nr:Zn(2)-C6 fungal-type domain-containing protein [Mycena chlorophos]
MRQRKNPPRPRGTVESLAEEVRQLRSELEATKRLAMSNGSSGSLLTTPSETPPTAPVPNVALQSSLHLLRQSLHSLIMPPPPPMPEDLQHLALVRRFDRIHLGTRSERVSRQFVGASSGIALVHAALDLKAHVNKQDQEPQRSSGRERSPALGSASSRRLQYWILKPWENTSIRTHALTFPPLPLMQDLIDLYFIHTNIYMPLLHRPTFEQSVRDGLFLRRRDDSFASVLLLVCAIASRWHPDPHIGAPGGTGLGKDSLYGVGSVSPPTTVLRDGEEIPRPRNPTAEHAARMAGTGTGAGLACGWAWFEQVPPDARHIYSQPTLYDLQYYSLACQFMERAASPTICWTLNGTALRLAQDLGIHRRTAEDEPPTAERELFKRALFDIDLPIDCDDEYWDHPTHPFKQPAGIPSKISFFNHLMGLSNILAASLRSLYGLEKFKNAFRAYGENWEETITAEIDSALNIWRDRIPEHLRWDSDNIDAMDAVFFDQSTALQCGFHYMEMFIHRPFIPMMRKTPTALPALAICTNAARQCATAIDLQRRRKVDVPVVFNFYSIFGSAVILLLNIWSIKRAARGMPVDLSRDLASVEKCKQAIKICEDRWLHAGMLWDIVAELSAVGQGQQTRTGESSNTANSRPKVPDDTRSPSAVVRSVTPIVGSQSPNAFDPRTADIDMLLDMDPDTMALWANAPGGLGVEDWDQYFQNLGELNEGSGDLEWR